MDKSMYKRLSCLPLLIAALILTFLPSGVVCNLAEEPGQVRLETFSYFDTAHFGYTNFAPLFAAIAVCVALLLLGVHCFTQWYWFAKAAKHFVFGGIVFSFFPLLLGVHGFSTVSVLLTGFLIVELALIHFLVGEPTSK